MTKPTDSKAPHPFIRHPHRTILALSTPVLLSLVAEPLTGLVDTAFVAQLGAAPLAALGVGAATLSSVFWSSTFWASAHRPMWRRPLAQARNAAPLALWGWR